MWGILDTKEYRFAPFSSEDWGKENAEDALGSMAEHEFDDFFWIKLPTSTVDMVNHPPHYTSNGIEVIDVIEAFSLGNARIANVIKYVLRHEHKNGTEDLKKALWYLQREVNAREAVDGQEG